MISSLPPRTRFLQAAAAAVRDEEQRGFIRQAMRGYFAAREAQRARYVSWDQARHQAALRKQEVLEHLDRYLEEFERKFTARGGRVFWAADGAEARAYILDLARARGVRTIVKSKCMTTEEIHLNEALEAAGVRVVESDLGEFIVQLRREPPYHFVFPSMHLKRDRIAALFAERLGATAADAPEELTMVARRVLRREFCSAQMGISGANFLVADIGAISITENEGNARLTTSLPPIHVAVVGIEKVIPSLDDLPLFLPVLAASATGQALACYNTIYSAPRLSSECDGPEEFHVVLLDNRRTTLLADLARRDALRCIRCGACLNFCPVYQAVGGHTYGTTYQGPIGSVIVPHLDGMRSWGHLSEASSLCGACSEVCPVEIRLHDHILSNRRGLVAVRRAPLTRLLFRAFTFVMLRPALYRRLAPLLRAAYRLHRPISGKRLDPLRAWTMTRALPIPAKSTFRALWRRRNAR